MDGFEANEGVILIAATNRPDVLDRRCSGRAASIPPGGGPHPDLKGREAILKVHTRRTPVAESVRPVHLGPSTPGFSGADLENLVNEAALFAARSSKELITWRIFEQAKDKVIRARNGKA